MKNLEQRATFANSGHALDNLQIFRDVDNRTVAGLLADCTVLRLAAGQSPADVGCMGARLFVVLSGALRVGADLHGEARPDTVDGSGTKVLPGECAGELAVLDEEAKAASMSAIEETELLAIDPETLWKLVDESNGVARNLLRLLAFRVRAANAQSRRRKKVGEFYRQMSLVDGLTDLQNRAWLNDQLPELVISAHAIGNPLSIIMIDIDHFKRFNDDHGHLTGDHALRVAAKVLTDTLRPRDFAARFGGEELIVILPNTNQKATAVVAQRLCNLMRESVIFNDMHKPLPHITASFGVASLVAGQDADDLLATADAALYRAKESGRNQVAL
jgi:diguanylate cyclase (GGDEF)-like protein